MTKTLKSLRRVKEKGVAVTGPTLLVPTLLIILKDYPTSYFVSIRHLYGSVRCLLVKCRFLSDTLSSYRDTIDLHL